MSLGGELSFTLGLRLRVGSLVERSGWVEAEIAERLAGCPSLAAAEPLLVNGYNPTTTNYHSRLSFARCGFYAIGSRWTGCGGARRAESRPAATSRQCEGLAKHMRIGSGSQPLARVRRAPGRAGRRLPPVRWRKSPASSASVGFD